MWTKGTQYCWSKWPKKNQNKKQPHKHLTGMPGTDSATCWQGKIKNKKQNQKRGSSGSDLQTNPETSAGIDDNKNSGLTLLCGFFSSFLFFQTNEIWDDCRFLNTLHIDTTSRFYFASLFEDDINIFSHLIHYCYSFLPLRWRRLASAELLPKLPDTSVRCFMSGIWRSVACLFECTHVRLNVRDYMTELWFLSTTLRHTNYPLYLLLQQHGWYSAEPNDINSNSQCRHRHPDSNAPAPNGPEAF